MTMRTVSFSIALFLFLVFWFAVLVAAIGTPVSTPIRVNAYEYAFNLSHLVGDAFFTVLPALLVAIALMLVDLFLHRKTPVVSLADKLPIVLLLLSLMTIGEVVNAYLLIMDKTLKAGAGWPNQYGLLILDTLWVSVPPLLLLATLFGHDLRRTFMISLPVVVLGSLTLKFFYLLANLKITF